MAILFGYPKLSPNCTEFQKKTRRLASRRIITEMMLKLALYQHFCNLHTIQRGALAHIIGNHPKI